MNVKTSTHIQKNISTGEIHCKSKQSEIVWCFRKCIIQWITKWKISAEIFFTLDIPMISGSVV